MRGRYSYLIVALLFTLLLAGCGEDSESNTSTQLPPATSIPGIGAPVTVNNAAVQVVDVAFPEQIGDQRAAAGQQLVEVRVEVSEGSSEEVGAWTVRLRDAAGTAYPSLVSGWGVFYGGATRAGWGFQVPADQNSLTLMLPDGTTIDLASLLATE